MSIRILLLLILHSGVCNSQEISDSVSFNFQNSVEQMKDSLHLSEAEEIRFDEILEEYGLRMKDAYENRTSWSKLNHVYQWSVRDRDSKMKDLLKDERFYYFKKRQKEIEVEARKAKRESVQ